MSAPNDGVGMNELNFEMEELAMQKEEKDVIEISSQTTKKKMGRMSNYNAEEDIALYYSWLNVSLDTVVGTNKSKETFWRGTEEYYRRMVKVESNLTKCSLSHH